VIDHRVICPQCNGVKEAYVRYGKNYIRSICPLCKGTGMAHRYAASAWLLDGVYKHRTRRSDVEDEE
jgi:hypothetical protein